MLQTNSNSTIFVQIVDDVFRLLNAEKYNFILYLIAAARCMVASCDLLNVIYLSQHISFDLRDTLDS